MKKAVEIVKIAAIAVLLVSLVCLSLIYMSFYRSETSVEFTPKMDAAVRDKIYRAGYVGLMNETLVRPYFFGHSFGGERVGFLSAGSDVLFGETVSDLTEFLGPDARFSSTDESAFRAVFESDFVYIRFRFELPRSMIYYMLNTDKILEEVGDEYIYDMAIAVGQSRQTYAVMRDLRGNYYVSYPDGNVSINKNTFGPYNDLEGGFAFTFVCESKEDTSLLTVGGKSADAYEILTPFDLTASSAVVETVEMPVGEDAERTLTILGLNPEKVTSHESDDGITYYDEGASVKTGKDGTIRYSALSAQYGIGISDIVGYEFSDNNYTVTDCVGASLVLADRLGVFDGDAFSYAVTFAEVDGADITVGLSYVYDGFTVLTDNVYALKITVTDGKVVSLDCALAKAHVYDGNTTVANTRWRARLALVDSEAPFGLEYIQTIRNSRLNLSLAAFEKGEGKK